MISKSIENAQKKVEGRNFDIRKHLLRYDDVLNTQRDVVYGQRREILEGGESLREIVFSSSEDIVREVVSDYLAGGTTARNLISPSSAKLSGEFSERRSR